MSEDGRAPEMKGCWTRRIRKVLTVGASKVEFSPRLVDSAGLSRIAKRQTGGAATSSLRGQTSKGVKSPPSYFMRLVIGYAKTIYISRRVLEC